MPDAPDIARTLTSLGVTHVVWLPDSTIGPWEGALESAKGIDLVRVCREGEAWAVAAGLWIGGCRPIVMIQNTGFFESGDALRNVLKDMKVPLYAIVGYRNALTEGSPDSARKFTEPILDVWQIEYEILDHHRPIESFADHYRRCQSAGIAGIGLLPEGS